MFFILWIREKATRIFKGWKGTADKRAVPSPRRGIKRAFLTDIASWYRAK